jgi:tellurite resistance protein TerC
VAREQGLALFLRSLALSRELPRRGDSGAAVAMGPPRAPRTLHSMSQTWLWIAFNAFVLGMLAIDLGVLNRKAHAISIKEASAWTVLWISLSLVFNYGIYHYMGRQAGLEFLTGYLIEKALSVDNIFVFVLLFSYFRVPAKYQHRVLFWGVLGALLMRGAMIAAGAVLIERFHWIIYVFGAFLVFTGIRMATQKEMDIEPESNPVLRLVRRFVPVSPAYDGQKFFTRQLVGGRTRRVATPLFIVVVLVETTDLIFAVDSIPAVFAITTDPFLVYTSNVFAILGLRALYFLLAGVIEKFHYLKLGLSAVLVFVGVKMLVTYFDVHIPIGISLAVVGGVLALSVAASLVFPKEAEEHSPVVHDPLEEDGRQ